MKADSEGGGILFYIILAIVGFLLSFLQKKSKPTNNVPMPKDIWDDLFDAEEELVVEPTTKKSEEFNQKVLVVTPKTQLLEENSLSKNSVNHETDPFYLAQYEGIPVFEYTDEIQKTEIGNIEDVKQESVSFDFDPKKAIIYTEILNRKYF